MAITPTQCLSRPFICSLLDTKARAGCDGVPAMASDNEERPRHSHSPPAERHRPGAAPSPRTLPLPGTSWTKIHSSLTFPHSLPAASWPLAQEFPPGYPWSLLGTLRKMLLKHLRLGNRRAAGIFCINAWGFRLFGIRSSWSGTVGRRRFAVRGWVVWYNSFLL